MPPNSPAPPPPPPPPPRPPRRPLRVVLLGATGSIGANTLEVVRGNPGALELAGIAGGSRVEPLAEVAAEFGVRDVALADPEACARARESGRFPRGTRFYAGPAGLEELASLPGADTVLAAAVGTAALRPVLAAIAAGKDIALASKEILVVAGRFVMGAAARHGVRIIPIDSEHNAIFQCLQGAREGEVAKLILTASGGAFRDFTPEQMAAITPEQAVRHPNWSMGPKITVDSSTMANKGLELVEARWLFGVRPEQLEVVVHPQSIVHSMVEFVDGSILAQLSPPSMTFAIQHGLLHPERAGGVHPTLDFSQALQLDFHPPDTARFPCLRLARESLGAGGTAPAVFNAANGAAVDAFLQGRLAYTAIAGVIEQALTAVAHREPADLDDALAAEAEAQRVAAEIVGAQP